MQMQWRHPKGLHLYPACQIARALCSAQSTVQFTCRASTIDAKSMIELMSLAVQVGHRVDVIISGEDADEVMNRLVHALDASVSWK